MRRMGLESNQITLNAMHTTVVTTRKDGSHTDYAIRVVSKRSGKEEIVYRRFSAFLQLQQLAQRLFHEKRFCCGSDGNCLLVTYLEAIFYTMQFPKLQGTVLGKNSKHVVRDRIFLLNTFLLQLETALNKIPPVTMDQCEKQRCKLVKLIKSFYGCLETNRKEHANSL